MQREGQNREKLHILMVSICRKFYRKRKILPASGEVFQRNTAAGRFGSRGQVENRASAEGQRAIFWEEGNRSARIEEAFLG